MPDVIFEHPRLVAIYDALDADRQDLAAYLAMVHEFSARDVLDLGCGTGVLALQLASLGLNVIGVDPAAGSLGYARTRPGAHSVRWIHGDAAALPTAAADLVLMTGNVAQAIIDPADWDTTLEEIHRALRAGGRLVFETRDPAQRAWQGWNRRATYREVRLPGLGDVETWIDLVSVKLPLVTFRHTWVFALDGVTMTSESTLRFRSRAEIRQDLVRHGFTVEEIRDAPDRPDLELVFVARRPG
jgi:ubiquinone/menaquinone biosynthesis C-methylase UbiE